MSDQETFYLVWIPGKGMPSHRHPTYDDAAKESARLAAKEVGHVCYVLQAMAALVAAPEPPPVVVTVLATAIRVTL